MVTASEVNGKEPYLHFGVHLILGASPGWQLLFDGFFASLKFQVSNFYSQFHQIPVM